MENKKSRDHYSSCPEDVYGGNTVYRGARYIGTSHPNIPGQIEIYVSHRIAELKETHCTLVIHRQLST